MMSGMVMVSGYSFFAPGPRAGGAGAVRPSQGARHRGGGRSGLGGVPDGSRAGQAFIGWTTGADWLFANQSEAEALCGASDIETQMRLLGRHYGNVVIKCGSVWALCVGGRDGVRADRCRRRW